MKQQNSLGVIGAFIGIVLASVGSAGTVHRPNPIDGGYTYYYGTTVGNTTANTNNVYGRLPMELHDYVPKAGCTNVAMLVCEDELWCPGDCQIVSQRGADAWLKLEQTNSLLRVDGRSGCDAVGVLQNSSSGIYQFKTMGGEVLSTMQCYLLGRSDAYYRTPRSDTYYVVQNTELWFFHPPSGYLGSPWVDKNGNPLADGYEGEGWTWKLDGAYDKFTITAEAGGQPVHLRSQDGCRDVTIHVVSDTFTFESLDVRFDGPEKRTLEQVLLSYGMSLPACGVESIASSDESRVVCVPDAKGGATIETKDWFWDDCEITVTDNDGNVILLRLVSMPGKISQECCASRSPKQISRNFKNLITDDQGKLIAGADWTPYNSSSNHPHGHTYGYRSKDSVFYNGERYSVCISSDRPIGVDDSHNTKLGQLASLLSGNKVVGWIEDKDGNRMIGGTLCFGNCGLYDLLVWRFGGGRDNIIYNNCANLNHHPYVGTYLDKKDNYQGMLADEYGYFTMFLPGYGNGPQGNDEFTVFLVSDAKSVSVHKEVTGFCDAGQSFDFTASYLDILDEPQTKRFLLKNGQTISFMVNVTSEVTVTESPKPGFATSAKVGDMPMFAPVNSLSDDGRPGPVTFDFRNVANLYRPWITDHADAGRGLVHLAFDPGLSIGPDELREWIAEAKEKGLVKVSRGVSESQLFAAYPEPIVRFRDDVGTQDVDRGWVWITVDASAITNCERHLWKVVIDDFQAAYADEIVRFTVDDSKFNKTILSPAEVAYEFNQAVDEVDVRLNGRSKIVRAQVVGGGSGQTLDVDLHGISPENNNRITFCVGGEGKDESSLLCVYGRLFTALGGAGGACGKVVLVVRDLSVPGASVQDESIGCFAGTFKVTVDSLGDVTSPVKVSAAWGKKDSGVGEFVVLSEDAKEGDNFAYSCENLTYGTEYEIEVKMETSEGVIARTVHPFTTKGPDFEVKYSNGEFLASVVEEQLGMTVLEDGTTRFVLADPTQTVKILVLKDATIDQALVVGGGGAGGTGIGGGGGGGQVLQKNNSVTVASGTLLSVSVGAGGLPSCDAPTGIGTTGSQNPGGNGGDSWLQINSEEPIVAIGGGGGASFNVNTKGSDGASGGGATCWSSKGGGSPTIPGVTGYAGGKVGTGGSDSCRAGGGGGASEPGEDGKTTSGRGGEGVVNDITGADEVYGSGGGGGGSNNPSVMPAPGGTHGGAGEQNSYGNPGADGFGGGGGGGGRGNPGLYPGGRGGNGTVIFVLTVKP